MLTSELFDVFGRFDCRHHFNNRRILGCFCAIAGLTIVALTPFATHVYGKHRHARFLERDLAVYEKCVSEIRQTGFPSNGQTVWFSFPQYGFSYRLGVDAMEKDPSALGFHLAQVGMDTFICPMKKL